MNQLVKKLKGLWIGIAQEYPARETSAEPMDGLRLYISNTP
jgi:hypothetical protein